MKKTSTDQKQTAMDTDDGIYYVQIDNDLYFTLMINALYGLKVKNLDSVRVDFRSNKMRLEIPFADKTGFVHLKFGTQQNIKKINKILLIQPVDLVSKILMIVQKNIPFIIQNDTIAGKLEILQQMFLVKPKGINEIEWSNTNQRELLSIQLNQIEESQFQWQNLEQVQKDELLNLNSDYLCKICIHETSLLQICLEQMANIKNLLIKFIIEPGVYIRLIAQDEIKTINSIDFKARGGYDFDIKYKAKQRVEFQYNQNQMGKLAKFLKACSLDKKYFQRQQLFLEVKEKGQMLLQSNSFINNISFDIMVFPRNMQD